MEENKQNPSNENYDPRFEVPTQAKRSFNHKICSMNLEIDNMHEQINDLEKEGRQREELSKTESDLLYLIFQKLKRTADEIREVIEIFNQLKPL